jgi:hypothetical protein
VSDRPPPIRSRAPSFSELASEITASHRLESDPPAVRWLDRRIGRAFRISAWWLWRTKAGTLSAAGLTGALTWLSQHFWHWIK